jgi:23S rRNA pseudouridine2605 synthase
MTDKRKQKPDQPESDRPELDDPLNTALESDEAIEADAESAAAASDTLEQAADALPETELDASQETEADDEGPAPEPPAKLERLQKILAQSGIASRRHAEELITEGRVQVNGKVVTELGSKADAARDHIRVDGKLLQGSERHRYFMLNKPKGYVTTVSDPEGRPTIMEFFSKTRERLYPVGRLDYLSEGLLLVTNDGELANKLTRAASNVEKAYLVKVSGQPSEEALERLRQGVGITKGKPGSDRVQTAPADIRPFRPGKPSGKRGPSRPVDNPWYEVVLIEGRNRELRKMFEEIGHHVEKIRRVGYGPLVLDLEPGNIRELEPEELENLRKAAEGKYRKPKVREPRKREFPKRSESRSDAPSKARWNERGSSPRTTGDAAGRESRPYGRTQPRFEPRRDSGSARPPARNQFRSEPRPEFRGGAPRPAPRFGEGRPPRPPRRDDQERRPFTGARENRGPARENRAPSSGDRPRDRSARPAWSNRPERGSRPPQFDRSAGASPSGRPNRFQRDDRGGAPGAFRPKPAEGRSKPFNDKRSGDGPNRFGPGKKLEIHPIDDERGSAETRSEPRNRPERAPFPARGGFRPDRNRSGGAPSGRIQQRRPTSGEPRSFDRERKGPPRFDRPARTERTGEPKAERPARPNRDSGQRSTKPRPAGSFKPGKRGPSAGKRGSARSGGGARRPNSRPGSNRPKRRP